MTGALYFCIKLYSMSYLLSVDSVWCFYFKCFSFGYLSHGVFSMSGALESSLVTLYPMDDPPTPTLGPFLKTLLETLVHDLQ